ncbi:hypothetical protein V8E54_000371 [Elaphomyces granulatus]
MAQETSSTPVWVQGRDFHNVVGKITHHGLSLLWSSGITENMRTSIENKEKSTKLARATAEWVFSEGPVATVQRVGMISEIVFLGSVFAATGIFPLVPNALNVRAVLTIVTAFRTTLIIVRAALRMKKVTGILYPAIGIQIDKKKKYRRIKLGK